MSWATRDLSSPEKPRKATFSLDRPATFLYFGNLFKGYTVLGDGLMVGQQTLTLPIGVRIPVPQPLFQIKEGDNFCHPLFVYASDNFCHSVVP